MSLQLVPRRFAEPAMLDFLKAVPDPPDQQVATELWRLAAVKLPPLAAKLIEIDVVQGVSWPRRLAIRIGAGFAATASGKSVTGDFHH